MARQAASMAFDRDLWIDTFHDVDNFAKEGLPLQTCWGVNSMSCNVQGDWLLDPRNKIKGREMGENAKYFDHNIAEAKKLMAAAGFANGVKTEYHGVTTADYGAQFPRMNEVLVLACPHCHGMNRPSATGASRRRWLRARRSAA